MTRVSKLNASKVENQLRQLHGNLAAVGRAFGVHRSTVKRFIDKRPKLLEIATDLREEMKDNAESALFSAVLAGDLTAIIFFLKTQAEDRGYVERNDLHLGGEIRQRVIEEEWNGAEDGGEKLNGRI